MFTAFLQRAYAPNLELDFISLWSALRTQRKCGEGGVMCALLEGFVVRVRDICVVAGILNLEIIDKAILVHF